MDIKCLHCYHYVKKETGGFCLEKDWDKDSEETECRDFEEGKPMTEKEFENNLF